MNRHINQTFQYQRRDEPGVQTPAETLKKNSGSCRDFATLMLEACRCWGLAARFVSGYMQCEATEAGGASTHAWTEVYLPGAGWKGFDPTSGIMTGAQHVTVAVSRNPENAAPIAGSFQGPANAFQGIQVDVTVVQIDRPLPPAAPVARFERLRAKSTAIAQPEPARPTGAANGATGVRGHGHGTHEVTREPAGAGPACENPLSENIQRTLSMMLFPAGA